MTAVKVVDASALGALLFQEPEAEAIAARLRGNTLVAPSLLGYEIASVCLKKLRGDPIAKEVILSQFALWDQMGVELIETDLHNIPTLAEQHGLTSYDACYLWLAERLSAELVTLDRRLAQAQRRRSGS